MPVDRVRTALPVLDDDEVLRDGLRGGRALALVALVSFLRELAPDHWTGPGLRAAFVFDDPNLRRSTYGHIDFRRMAAHGDAHDYHAAMAMVPLDGVRAHPDAVRTFRARPDRLSVVMHGNDHTRNELLRPRDERSALALGAQALRRIAAFERINGVAVDRVMMPPHGLCSRVVAQALGRLGYDALCAIHPSPWTERPASERLLAGWMPADFVDGCTVIPRFPLACATYEIALRAFLGQPLVLYGHHGDMAAGLDPLAEAAARINGLGPVDWCSLGEIVRRNHQLRMEGTVAVVRPWAGTLRVTLPEHATELAVDAPPGGVATGLSGWTTADGGADPVPFGSARLLDVSRGERDVLVHLCGQAPTDPRSVSDPRGRPWPLLRRRATETRDRLAPHARRWSRDRFAMESV